MTLRSRVPISVLSLRQWQPNEIRRQPSGRYSQRCLGGSDDAGRAAGLDLNQVIEMVAPGAGGSRMFQMRAPMMANRSYEPATMRISTWKKDMAIIAEFASELGCKTPLFTTTQPVYAQAMAMGLGNQDTAAVFEVLKTNGT